MNQKIIKLLIIGSSALMGLSYLMTTPNEMLLGMGRIITHRDMLIADYLKIGGLAAGIFNASLLVLISTILVVIVKAPINGLNIAAIVLMGSFGLFGKNIFSVVPIIFGTYLYSLMSKDDFKDLIAISFFATCFSPVVTELVFFTQINLFLALCVGMSVGFLITPVSRHLFQVHKGFNLYNIGFSIGILSTLYVSIMKSYGYQPYSQLVLSSFNNGFVYLILQTFFIAIFIIGILDDKNALKKMALLFKESGYQDNDFYIKYGLGTTLINMAINGTLALFYVVVIAKGDLNGPTIGGIFTVVGFSGLGKHAFNIIPIFLGVYLGSLTHFWNANDTAIIFAALFGTALAPIAGHFGFFYGVIASFINASVVLSSGALHAGLNLYNTGFSVGIVAAVLVPLFMAFEVKVDELMQKRSPR